MQIVSILTNEGYMCNICKVGKVRPIQFSLKQAVINCDNPDCDSYLEKWPWECVVTRPILNSPYLCRYEKDSKCNSNDSSDIHSDLESSGVSQYSVTDWKVKTLLQKSYTSDFNFESIDKIQHTLQWQSGTNIQQQEQFVALDDKMFFTDMLSKDTFFESKYNLLVNNFQSEEESRNIKASTRQRLISLLSDTYVEGSSGLNISQDKDTHYRSNIDNDTESWFCKSKSSDILENSIKNNCDKRQLENENHSHVKENNLSTLVKPEIFPKVEEEEAHDPLADVNFKSEEYESNFELPISTVDENDDLKLDVPVKDEIKVEKELDIVIHNLISIQDYSRKKKVRYKNLGNSRAKNCSAISCQLLPNSCGNSLNVIDTQSHLFSRPSHYNLSIELFTMGQRLDKFGDLKKEPEFFEAYLSDHDDSKDEFSSLGKANFSVDFLCEMNESENFGVCEKEKTLKIPKCCKILKNKSYMSQLLNSCLCNNSLNSDFDTSLAKPFNNLSSNLNSKNSNKKNLRSSSVSSSLSNNTTGPDVLNLSPVINSKLPEHSISTTILPVLLQEKYSDMESVMVSLCPTDKEVSVPHKKNSVFKNNKNVRKNLKSNSIQKHKTDKKNNNSGFDIFIKNKFLKNENFSFNDLNSNCCFEPPPKRKKKELEVNPLCVYNDLGLKDKSTQKNFKTNDGSCIQSCIKKEAEKTLGYSEESSIFMSEESIEFSDDHLAYEEAIKSDYNVSAPPTQVKKVYISSHPIKTKIKTRNRNERKCKLCLQY